MLASAAELTTILVPQRHLSSLGGEIENGKVGDAAIHNLGPETLTPFLLPFHHRNFMKLVYSNHDYSIRPFRTWHA